MALPGFSADASLYVSSEQYRAALLGVPTHAVTIPQVECVVDIDCYWNCASDCDDCSGLPPPEQGACLQRAEACRSRCYDSCLPRACRA
jgi:hypothetical protein